MPGGEIAVEGSAAALLTEEAFAALRGKPGFRDACEAAAAQSVQFFAGLDRTSQWIIKDLGRVGICITAAVLHATGTLTLQTLAAGATAMRLSSLGRVDQLVRRWQEIGQFTIEDGPAGRTRRRARLGPELLAMLQRRGLCDMRAAAMLEPELGDALAILETEDGFVSLMIQMAMISTERRDLFSFRDEGPLTLFLEREAGMSILFDLMVSQPRGRSRLLEEAPLSRYALSQRYGVSRVHINKLLADCGHTCAVGDRVVFSETLSEALERYFALVFLHYQISARPLLDGWRYAPPQSVAHAPSSSGRLASSASAAS